VGPLVIPGVTQLPRQSLEGNTHPGTIGNRMRRAATTFARAVDRFSVDRFSVNLPSTGEKVCKSTPITPHSCFFRSVPRTKRLMTSIWR
jgi:hypothetical protein